MAEVKWIKLSTNMFDDEKIRLIEALPESDTILIIWVKLLAQAGKTNASGYIYLNENIPFNEEMLATIFNRPLATVRLALKTFQQFGMIEITENNFISITNWEKHQNIDGLEKIREDTRKRVQEHRDRKKQKLLGTIQKICAYCGKKAETIDHIIPRSKGGKDITSNVVDACKSCNSSKKDKDLSDFLNDSFYYTHQGIDHDLVRSNEKLMTFVKYDEKSNSYCNVTVTVGNALEEEEEKEEEKNITTTAAKNPIIFFEEALCRLSPIQSEKLYQWVDDFNGNSEIINEAILIADDRNKRTFGFVEYLLKEWFNNKLESLDRVRAYEQEKFNKQKNVKSGTKKKSLFEQGEESKKRQAEAMANYKPLAPGELDELPF